MAKVAERGNVEWIVDQAAVFLGVEPADLKMPSARSMHRETWRIAVYAAWAVSERSAAEIGRVLGGADHTRIMMARDIVRERITQDPEFHDKIAKLLEYLRAALLEKVAERGSVEWIVDQAAGFLGVKAADIKKASPHSKYRESWRIAAHAAWEVGEHDAGKIGRVLGGADYAAIIVAREMVRERIANDPEFRDRVAKLLEDLRIALF